MIIPSFVVGNAVVCRFCFVSRKLTRQESAEFLRGGPLPDTVGEDVPIALLDYRAPKGEIVTVESGIEHLGNGEYAVAITPDRGGQYRWRGRAMTLGKVPIASTAVQRFTAENF